MHKVFILFAASVPALASVQPAFAYNVADDPFAPAASQVEARFTVIAQEISRLAAAGDTAASLAMSAQLQQFNAEYLGLTPSVLTTPEIDLVTVYQPSSPLGSIRVDVDVTDRPIVLALGGAQSATWDLHLAPGVQLQRVLVPSDAQTVLNLPAGVTAEPIAPGYWWGAGKESDVYPFAASTLSQNTGGLTVASVQGDYTASTSPYSVGPANADWRAQRILRETNALYTQATTFARAPGRALASSLPITALLLDPHPDTPWPSGSHVIRSSAIGDVAGPSIPVPSDYTHVAIDPAGPTYYVTATGGAFARLDPATGATTNIPMTNPDLSPLEWLVGAAFDTTRHRVVLASLGGDGWLRAYDPATGHWSELASLHGVDLGALAYHAADDSFYGIGDGQISDGRTLYRYAHDGTLLSTINLDANFAFASQFADDAQLIDAGQYLVLLRPDVPDYYEPERPAGTWSYVINPADGQILYSAPFALPEPAALTACAALLPLLRRNRRPAAPHGRA